MCLVTGFNIWVEMVNYLLVFIIVVLLIYLWIISVISVGVIVVVVSLFLCINGMFKWIMWEVSVLFENIGIVVDGMIMLGKFIIVIDKFDVKFLVVKYGGIIFDDVSFYYGENKGVINYFNFNIKLGEKVGLVGCFGAGKLILVNLLLCFYDVESG